MSETICELKIKVYCAIAQPILLFRPPGCIVFNFLCQKTSRASSNSVFLSFVILSFRICSIIVMLISLSNLWLVWLCKKWSVSSQLLTAVFTWFLWLFRRILALVSLLPIYCKLHFVHSIIEITMMTGSPQSGIFYILSHSGFPWTFPLFLCTCTSCISVFCRVAAVYRVIF